jgi:predicted patatin/cPLA2 family phospholipase
MDVTQHGLRAAQTVGPASPRVLDLLFERRAAGSTPGTRTDPHRLALVIEGGGSRAAYSTGMIGAIHELGLTDCFDAVYGSSAGALNGAWLLCGRAPEAMVGWTAPGVMRKVMSTRRALRGRPVVDLDYLINVL